MNLEITTLHFYLENQFWGGKKSLHDIYRLYITLVGTIFSPHPLDQLWQQNILILVRFEILMTLMIAAANTSETVPFYQSTWHNVEDSRL